MGSKGQDRKHVSASTCTIKEAAYKISIYTCHYQCAMPRVVEMFFLCECVFALQKIMQAYKIQITIRFLKMLRIRKGITFF